VTPEDAHYDLTDCRDLLTVRLFVVSVGATYWQGNRHAHATYPLGCLSTVA